ncbi:hypothetical protein IGI04_014114 [Brassica rapa subsp. trilocularis]|uniref:Zinc knuckle CX2CX4HX4C domain-containing protein n=1 Tax=Brassica rapa subsp. trilocularis TaxID=1813537 RepID=A0ABQ7MLF7_BRACM|nr:hypothetical protein IGI04_014114 [Brassica rapa subsp. trilocularis]
MKLDISLPSGEIKEVELEYENLEKHCFHCLSLTHEGDACPTFPRKENRDGRETRLGISQNRTLERLEADRRRKDEKKGSRNLNWNPNENFAASTRWKNEEHKDSSWRSESNPPYDYGIRTDPHRRPVIAGAKSSTPQRLSHSQATHTPSPRPQREGPSIQLVTPVANQRSEDRGNHSSERRSALERLSHPKVRIPLLHDGFANSASGRLQEVDIQYLEDNLNHQTSGGSCRPSGSKDKRPIGEVDQQGFTDRSPIRSLSEDRIHVSLRLGQVNNPEPNLNGTGKGKGELTLRLKEADRQESN